MSTPRRVWQIPIIEKSVREGLYVFKSVSVIPLKRDLICYLMFPIMMQAVDIGRYTNECKPGAPRLDEVHDGEYFGCFLLFHAIEFEQERHFNQLYLLQSQKINTRLGKLGLSIFKYYYYFLLRLSISVLVVQQQKNKYKQISLALRKYNNNLMEQESYAIFLDDSGSVGGFRNYWKVVGDILAEYASKITNYYLWHHDTRVSSKKEFEDAIANMRGGGGNQAWKVAEQIVKQKYYNIILITDGQIMDYDVQKCDATLEEAQKNGFTIKKAVCYTIGYRGEPNLSVTCAFTRYGESRVYSKGGDAELRTVMQYTKEDFKILSEFAEISVENFQINYPKIQELIIAKNMGRNSNEQLKDQLVHMKTRLIKEYSKELGKKQAISSKIRKELRNNNIDQALELASKMATNYLQNDTISDLEKKINNLITICGDLRGKYTIGQIKSNKMATATRAVGGKIDQTVQTEDLSKNPIECPIIMDEDVPQILIDDCEPFLLDLEKGIVDDINACPLRILNYPDLKAKFKSRISTYTGVKYSDKMKLNPYTRKRLLGSIPLGSHRSHVTVGNHTIAHLVSGGKVMGNLNMYFAVIWILVNQDEIEYLKPIKANLTEHLIHRLINSQTMASMCGLSQFVSTQISTDIAVWFCVNSGFTNQLPEKDTLRFHLFDIDSMLKIVDVLGYPIHSGFTRHYLRTRALFYFLDKFKRSNGSQRKALKTLFKGLYQRGYLVDSSKFTPKFREVEVCTEFIPIDGAADEEQIKEVRKRMPKFCQKLTNEDLYYISGLLDESKLFSDIFLDYNVKIPSLPAPECSWKFGFEEFKNDVQINCKTLRPLLSVEGEKWQNCAKNAFKVESTNELFKGCKYLEEFILKHKKIPNHNEIAVFYYNRYVESGKRKTLPYQTKTWIEDLLKKYQAATEGLDIKEIISCLKESRALVKRAEIEHSI